MKIDMYEVTTEVLGEIATTGAKMMLTRLYDDGLVTEDQLREYYLNYAVIVKKPSFFSQMWSKLRKGEDKPLYILVKQVSLQADADASKAEGVV